MIELLKALFGFGDEEYAFIFDNPEEHERIPHPKTYDRYDPKYGLHQV